MEGMILKKQFRSSVEDLYANLTAFFDIGSMDHTRLAFIVLQALYDCTVLHFIFHYFSQKKVFELLKRIPKEQLFPLLIMQTFYGMSPMHLMTSVPPSPLDGLLYDMSTVCKNIMNLLKPSERIGVMMIQDNGGQTILHQLATLPGSLDLARPLSDTAEEHKLWNAFFRCWI